MAQPQSKPQHLTYRDYVHLPADQRWELIDGEAVCMSPAPTTVHQRLVVAILAQLVNQLAGKRCEPFVAPFDVLLPRADEADDDVDTVLQPDIVVFCDPDKVRDKNARGAPDFVVEVLSPSTAGRDLVAKRRKYERAGVRELWFVHPVDRVVFVLRLVDGRFVDGQPTELDGATAVGVLDGVSIDWTVACARLGPVEP
ncbi:MAG: Uma2 family endonuclease [Deltaproteobacteria bacterium]|nr:Uma2 family endonuclease [Deltaproteobacteria bacterium]